jgi:hypothetical protein
MPGDRGDRAEHGRERPPRGDRDRHEHQHEGGTQRGHDAEAAACPRPERAQQQREYRERSEHDDRVHDERMQGQSGDLDEVAGRERCDDRGIHAENTSRTPGRFTSTAG